MKNIKKVLFYFCFLLLGILVFQQPVYAEADCDKYACATCIYQSDFGTFTYNVKATGDGSVKTDFTSALNRGVLLKENGVSNSYFINSNTNKIECYPIYLKKEAGSREAYVRLSNTNDEGTIKLSASDTSTNNGKTLTVEDIKHISCDFSDALSTCTITSTEDKLSDSCTNGYSLSNNELEVSDFGYGTSCPKASLVCSNQGGKYCALQKPGSIGPGNPQQGTETETGNEIQSKNEYTCSYKGQISGKTLTITKVSSKWDVTYPDGSTKEFTYDGSNSFPSNECEDVFYVKNNNNVQIVKIKANTIHTETQISQLCNGYGNEVEQFCHDGKCKISNALCGTGLIDDDEKNGEGCPWELRAVIIFLKKIAFNTVQLFVPIILIVMGTIDFVKAIASTDDKGNKEAISKFIKRCLAALMVFFVGTIVSIVMNMFAKTDVGEQNDWKTCWQSIE